MPSTCHHCGALELHTERESHGRALGIVAQGEPAAIRTRQGRQMRGKRPSGVAGPLKPRSEHNAADGLTLVAQEDAPHRSSLLGSCRLVESGARASVEKKGSESVPPIDLPSILPWSFLPASQNVSRFDKGFIDVNRFYPKTPLS